MERELTVSILWLSCLPRRLSFTVSKRIKAQRHAFCAFCASGVNPGPPISDGESHAQPPPVKDGEKHNPERDPLSSVIESHAPCRERLLPEVAMEVQKTPEVEEPYKENADKEKHGQPSQPRLRDVEKHEVVYEGGANGVKLEGTDSHDGDRACEEQPKGQVEENDASGVVADPVNRTEGPNGLAGRKGRNEYDGQGTRDGAYWNNQDGRDGEKPRERKEKKKGKYGGSVEREVKELQGEDVGSEEMTWRDAMEERNKIASLIGELESIRIHAIDLEHKNAHCVKNADK